MLAKIFGVFAGLINIPCCIVSSKNNLSRDIQEGSTSTKSPQKKAAVGFGEAYKGFLKTHVTPKIKCQYCSEPFPDIKQVVAHYNEKHKKNFDICGYCNFITTSETLAKHMSNCKKNPKNLNPGTIRVTSLEHLSVVEFSG